jgi:Ca2+/Na+ antiporter
MRIELDMAKSARRGETISLVFAMQAVGAVVGSLVIMALIYFGQQSVINCDLPGRNSMGNNAEALNGVWRAFYFIGLLQVLVLLIYRGVVAEETESFAKVQQRQNRRKIKHGKTYLLNILWFYSPRLVSTAGCW